MRPPGLSAAEAGLRYYVRMGRLAIDCVEALVPALVDERRRNGDAELSSTGTTIVIEAEAGAYGLGVFLVENRTAGSVSVPVAVSTFVDRNGREVRPTVKFRPDVISLEPGDQLAVQVAAAVDETLEPEVRYRGEISVPGLSETRIPIVVRRRPSSAAPPRSRRDRPRALRAGGQAKIRRS